MPAPLALFSRRGGRDPSPRTPPETEDAEDHRRQLDSNKTRNQARSTYGRPPNRSRGHTENCQRRQHNEGGGQSRDHDHGKEST